MKLTEEQVRQITAKVYKDLNLDHDPRYPIRCRFHENNSFGINVWSGRYDYREIGKYGEEHTGVYTDYILSIDDEKGVAVAVHHYSAHMLIVLNDEGKYVYGKQMYRNPKQG